MTNLFARLLALLGTRFNERPIFELVRDLGEVPEGCDFTNPLQFNTSNISFDFYSRGFFSVRFGFGTVNLITMKMKTPLIQSGILPFADLPFGILVTDTPEVVESKFGLKSFSSSASSRAYYKSPHLFVFHFDEDGEMIELSIEYRPE